MTIITDKNHIIVSISLITGIGHIPSSYHVYEYVDLNGYKIGDYYNPSE
jgi:hypothetical protein